MDRARLLSQIDRTTSLDFLAAMVRYKSYSGTPGESELARFMVRIATPPSFSIRIWSKATSSSPQAPTVGPAGVSSETSAGRPATLPDGLGSEKGHTFASKFAKAWRLVPQGFSS